MGSAREASRVLHFRNEDPPLQPYRRMSSVGLHAALVPRYRTATAAIVLPSALRALVLRFSLTDPSPRQSLTIFLVLCPSADFTPQGLTISQGFTVSNGTLSGAFSNYSSQVSAGNFDEAVVRVLALVSENND